MTDMQNSQSAGDLRNSKKELDLAAGDLGIQPHEPLGIFVSKMGKVLVTLADTMERFQHGIESRIDEVGKIGKIEVKKLEEANAHAENMIKAAKTALVITDSAREDAIKAVVGEIGPEVVKKLGPWLVQRQTQLDRQRQWKRLMAGCLLGLGLVVVGYQWRSFEDDSIISGLDRCRVENINATFPGDKNSVPICKLDDLLAVPKGGLKDRLADYFWRGSGEAKAEGGGGG